MKFTGRAIAALVWSVAVLAGAGAVAEGDAVGVEFEPGVVAIVNGDTIRVGDLEARLGAMHGEAVMGSRSGFSLDRLVDRMVNDLLLAQEARTLDMQNEPPTDDQVRRYKENLLLDTMSREEFKEKSVPTEEEIEARYAVMYRKVTLRILTTLEREQAEAALARLQDGEDFVAMVAELSVDPYREREGFVDGITRMKLQREIGDVAFRVEPGTLCGPIQTKLGYSVFRVESHEEAAPDGLPAVRSIVAALIRQEKMTALRDAMSIHLRETFPVTINQEAVDAIGFKRLPDSRLIQDVPDPDAILARIGEVRVIVAGEYGLELLSRLGGVRNEDAAYATKPIVLGRMVERQLFLAEAVRRKVPERPEYLRAVRKKENELTVPRYLEDVVAADIEVTEDEMQAYYAANVEHFGRPPRLRLGQITVASREEAERVAGLLRDGADLAWLARKSSIDRFKDAGGDRGWMTPTPGLDDMQDWLMAAQPGAVHDPFGSEGNWVVVAVMTKEEQGAYGFKEISGNIREKVFKEKFAVKLDTFMTQLRERSDIRMNETALDDLRVTGAHDDAVEEEDPHGGHSH